MSNARSPRLVCSMTIGTRAFIRGSKSYMLFDSPVPRAPTPPREVGLIGFDPSGSPPANSDGTASRSGSGLGSAFSLGCAFSFGRAFGFIRIAHQFIDRYSLLIHLSEFKDEVDDLIFEQGRPYVVDRPRRVAEELEHLTLLTRIALRLGDQRPVQFVLGNLYIVAPAHF